MATFDVYGMCNPLFDLQADVSEQMLADLGFVKGSMSLIGHDQQRDLLPKIYEEIVNTEPGGSGANTMIALGLLGGTGVFTGHVGFDEHAHMYQQGLLAAGIRPALGQSDGPTGLCVVLVTPDAERTMCTFLGKAQDLTRQDIAVADLQNSKYLYVTGYLWDTDGQKEAVRYAMQVANQAGVKVAFSLSDPFCVRRHREEFLDLIHHHVDVLFGNDEEVMTLAGSGDLDRALETLAPDCGLIAVTRGSRGSILRHGSERIDIPAYAVDAVDTTGAGDAYAAGILHGMSEGLPISSTGLLASYVAGKVVAKLGPRLTELDLESVRLIKNGLSLDEIAGLEKTASAV